VLQASSEELTADAEVICGLRQVPPGGPHDLCFLTRGNIVCPGRQGRNTPPPPRPDHLYCKH
jgi:hypothetical protein